MVVDPDKKVYVPVNWCDTPKMHLKHDCSCLTKKGIAIEKVYLTQEEARLQFKAVEFCKKCCKKKSRMGGKR
jgi:hypothetical protein